MSLLGSATDWTNQTNEERAEQCIAFLHVHNIIPSAVEYRRMLNTIRAVADAERELKARKV